MPGTRESPAPTVGDDISSRCHDRRRARDGSRSLGRLVTVLLAVAAVTGPVRADAQIVPVRTVPVASGDQFLLHPSASLGMGGPSAALADTLADSFVNPAKGARLRGSRLLSAPTVYGISDDNGGGRTLPVSYLLGSEAWFGGASLSLQEVERASRDRGAVILPASSVVPSPPRLLAEESAVNSHASGFLGRRVGGGPLAVGAAASWSDLGALQGVGNLYAGSEGIRQSGHLVDVRAGLTWDGEDGRSAEALLLHRRLRMTHEVAFREFVPAESPCTMAPCGSWQIREETNLDHTNTSGLHLGYVAPLAASGWRLGGAVTVNRKSHPKIPNYEIMRIPRDPGDTWAYSFAVGVAGGPDVTTYAVDVAFQPAWTETWATADTALAREGGGTILPGERTVDNDFSFTNLEIRLGLDHGFGPAGMQLGLRVRSVDYTLEQVDHVERSFRELEESWLVWTPSWGARVRLSDVVLRYAGRLVMGTGRPGVTTPFRAQSGTQLAAGGADFLPAPRGPLTLEDATVFTNQVSLEVPIR